MSDLFKYTDKVDDQDSILIEEDESQPLLGNEPTPHPHQTTTEFSLRNDSLLRNYTFASKFEDQQRQQQNQQQQHSRSLIRNNQSSTQSTTPLFYNNINISYESQSNVY
jgi:hypothetical protein